MRALFARKIPNLDELKEATAGAIRRGETGERYTVTQEVKLTDASFNDFAADLLADQPWIDPKADCIRVINQETGEKVLIDSQGYQYPRYTALEME